MERSVSLGLDCVNGSCRNSSSSNDDNNGKNAISHLWVVVKVQEW